MERPSESNSSREPKQVCCSCRLPHLKGGVLAEVKGSVMGYEFHRYIGVKEFTKRRLRDVGRKGFFENDEQLFEMFDKWFQDNF